MTRKDALEPGSAGIPACIVTCKTFEKKIAGDETMQAGMPALLAKC